jgi:hypothetical protein
MADTATKTAAPRKRTAGAKAAAAKTTPKVTPKATTVAPPAEETQRIQLTLAGPYEETKSYAKFDLKADVDGNSTGCVGTLYAPLGTRTVKILLVGEEIEEAVAE